MFQSILKLTKVNKGEEANETLHIGANRNRIKGYINVLRMRDKDTHQIILYAPSLEMTSYGETHAKAEEMFNGALHSFFDYLLGLSSGKLAEVLKELGWKKEKLRNKDFSKVLVDIEGNLKNFNIEEDKVERLALIS